MVKGKERRRRAMLSTRFINSKLRDPRTNPLIIARSKRNSGGNQSIEMIKESLQIKEKPENIKENQKMHSENNRKW